MANDNSTKKTYTEPAIIYDLELETKAGSPLGLPEGLPDPALDD